MKETTYIVQVESCFGVWSDVESALCVEVATALMVTWSNHPDKLVRLVERTDTVLKA